MKAIREQSASPQARIRHAIVGALVFALAFAALTCFATAQQAQADEDGGQGSITFTDCKAPGQIFTVYQIAQRNGDGNFVLDAAWQNAAADSGIDVSGFNRSTKASTLKRAAETFAGYAAKNASPATKRTATVEGGRAYFGNLDAGMYLVLARPATVGSTTYYQQPYLVSIPSENEDGSVTDNVSVTADKVTETSKKVSANRVQKLWDDESPSARPSSVAVQIYNGDALYRQVELNAGNNWTYEWKGTGDWRVREAVVPDGYHCSVSKTMDAGKAKPTLAFHITNKKSTDNGGSQSSNGGGSTLPLTGDWLPVLAVVLIAVGAGLVIVALARRKKNEDRA